MNIPEEYWTKEAPTEPGVYAVKWHDGVVSVQMLRPQHNREEFAAWHRGCRFFRLAPAAELDRLKAENEKLRELGAALRKSVSALVHSSGSAMTETARAELRVEAWNAYIARLEGRAE